MDVSALSPEQSNVVAALRNAAAATGSDFHYLLGTAMRESGLKAGAQSATSSATGLFQFVDQTWLGLVKEHGARYGLGGEANAITKGADGKYRADPGARAAILALRKDPGVAALMAGEYTRNTAASLTAALGRPVCGGELYAAHFLGPDAACKLIQLSTSDPAANAARQFPAAAAANRSVFYHADGSARTVREVYDWAMRQPGGADTVRAAPAPAPAAADAGLAVAKAHGSEIESLLASVMDWQPRDFFSDTETGATGFNPGGGALSFGPGLLGLLSDARQG